MTDTTEKMNKALNGISARLDREAGFAFKSGETALIKEALREAFLAGHNAGWSDGINAARR